MKQSLMIGLSFHLILGLLITLALFHPIIAYKEAVIKGIEQAMSHK
jgi:hypothetical protein